MTRVVGLFLGIFSLLASLGCSSNKPAWGKSYEEGLVYDKGFRDLALIVFADLAETEDDLQQREFWQMMHQLEERAQDVMRPLRAKYGITDEVTGKTKTMVWVVDKAIWIMPETFWNYLEGSAERFIVQLNGIKAMGPEEDQPLLTFMVEQEETVLAFLQHYNRGELDEAGQILRQALEAGQ